MCCSLTQQVYSMAQSHHTAGRITPPLERFTSKSLRLFHNWSWCMVLLCILKLSLIPLLQLYTTLPTHIALSAVSNRVCGERGRGRRDGLRRGRRGDCLACSSPKLSPTVQSYRGEMPGDSLSATTGAVLQTRRMVTVCRCQPW